MKKSKAKRAISWLIAAAMASSICGFEVSLVSATGGTRITGATESLGNEAYYISDEVGLIKFSQLVNAGEVAANTKTPEVPIIGAPAHPDSGGSYVYLTSDIDLGDVSGADSGFNPIGTSSGQFKSMFDGQGHEVELTLNRENSSYVGIFGDVGTNGLVCNLGVAGTVIRKDRVGGVAGVSWGMVSNCYNTGDVRGSGDYQVGGIAGMSSGTVSNCYNSGELSGRDRVGGIAGGSNGTVSNCYNMGNVSGSGGGVGAVVGEIYSTSTVGNCYYLEGTADSGVGSGSGSATPKETDYMKTSEFVAELNSGPEGANPFAKAPANLNDGFPVLKGLGHFVYAGAKVSIGGSGGHLMRTYVEEDGNVGKWEHVKGMMRFKAKPGYKLDRVIKNGAPIRFSSPDWLVSKRGASYLGEVNLSDSYTVLFARDE